jgi:hypothetical protein
LFERVCFDRVIVGRGGANEAGVRENIRAVGIVLLCSGRGHEEDSMKRIWRSLPAGAGLFFLGVALFLVGAINAAWHGLHETMQVGLLGTAAAIGIA